jgi:calcineurin-like phosphoesterase family protein
MSQHFDEFGDERRWLGPPPRHRRWRLLVGLLVVALTLVWPGLGQRSQVPRPAPARPSAPTAEQQALEAGRRALEAWGRFAVTNHLGTLRRWFWTRGPQHRLLAGEAKLRRGTKPLGPPAYRFILAPVSVLAPSPRHRILRGRVRVTRPGGPSQSYAWDLWMRRDASSGGRWRLWTVQPTREPRARSAADPVVVAAAGDIAEAGGHHRLTSNRVLEVHPNAVLLLGDNQYPSGRLDQYRRLYGPTWGRFKAKTRPAPGNHEYRTPGAAGYIGYFGKRAKPKGRSYYSFDLGGWHLIALNSSIDHGPGSAQERWLRADLVATAKRCILAYWHYPRFSSGAHHGDWGPVAAFWNDLYDAHADVVLSGHEHSYERFARQTPWAKADWRGLRQFVVGTGGAGLLGFAAPKPNSQVRIGDTHGVLKLVLHPTSYEWRFISEDGAVLDRGGPVACHRGSQTDLPVADG